MSAHREPFTGGISWFIRDLMFLFIALNVASMVIRVMAEGTYANRLSASLLYASVYCLAYLCRRRTPEEA